MEAPEIRIPHSLSWDPCPETERSFVRFRNPDMGQTWIAREEGDPPVVVSVVIPTSDADRQGYFPKLLDQVHSQIFRNFELIIIKGDSRQGRAINTGAALARGKYMIILDDDTSLPDSGTFGKLVAVMDAHPEIGMAGGNNVLPADCPPFIKRVMEEIPRRAWDPVRKITESDLAEHPCLIMRVDDFKSVGGENELIPRGLDPYLRQAFRDFGMRVVLVPDIVYHHLPPGSWNKLLRQFYRNGRNAAYVNRHYPQWMIETPRAHGPFKPRRSLLFRIIRFQLTLLGALFARKFVLFLSEAAYASGFLHEYMSGKQSPGARS